MYPGQRRGKLLMVLRSVELAFMLGVIVITSLAAKVRGSTWRRHGTAKDRNKVQK
ncbi:hypothetical protein BDV29DRAFT_166103 [Aspergillus leporis]|uniref:Uncharacterized protein n=1 Tax=Aspergillus leporis TaxID=41062 RepID=A0A5N5XHH4_9EURO|nr:hypothetical protein BDV29DRAFT_166103 [Aspergillus leporis]